MANRDPKTKMELIGMLLRTHKEIERLHIENVSAPWFQAYMSNKLANTASAFNPALSRPAACCSCPYSCCITPCSIVQR